MHSTYILHTFYIHSTCILHAFYIHSTCVVHVHVDPLLPMPHIAFSSLSRSLPPPILHAFSIHAFYMHSTCILQSCIFPCIVHAFSMHSICIIHAFPCILHALYSVVHVDPTFCCVLSSPASLEIQVFGDIDCTLRTIQ